MQPTTPASLKPQNQPQPTLRRTLLYTALLAGGMVLLIYALLGIYPFGDGTLLTGDLNSQYINYFAHFKRFFAGDAGFAYSFGKSLGGGLIGLFAYYVASPLNLLYLLLPLRAFPLAASFLFLVKILLASVFCAYFLLKKFPPLAWRAIPLALAYAFTAYSFAYAQNIMWHDVLLLLPLLCLGVDHILAGKSFALYTSLLALAIFANFYIAYMACIFLVLYFAWSWLSLPPTSSRQNEVTRDLSLTQSPPPTASQQNQTTRPPLKKPLLSFIGGSLLAGGLNAALLLPTLANLNESKGALLNASFTVGTNFPLRLFPERFVFANFQWPDVEAGLPQVYCGVAVLLLALCYFISRAVPLREKLLSGGLVAFFLLSFYTQPLDTLWHALKAPVWFPYRYSFLFVFVLVLLAASAFAKGALRQKELLLSGGILTAAFLLMLVFPASVSRSKILLTLAALLAVAACLYLLQTLRDKTPQDKATAPSAKWAKRLLALAVVGITAVEMAASGFYITNQFEKYPLSGYQAFVQNGTATIEAIQAADPADYRIEKTFFRNLNDPMLLHYNGISHFGSTQDTAAVNALLNLGYRSYNGCGPYFYGSTAFADSLLGIRYIFEDGSRPLPPHLVSSGLNTPYAVYENPTALPLLFTAPDAARQAQSDGLAANSFAWQNELYTALGGDGTLFLPANATLQDAAGAPQPLESPLLPGSAYTVTATEDGLYYALIEAPLYDLPFFINNQEVGRYFSADHSGILNLGQLKKGQTVTLHFGQTEGIAVQTAQFAYLTPTALRAFATQKQQTNGNFTLQDGHVSGSITAQKGETTLFTSIPYDAGWSATVNGQNVIPSKVMGSFLALPLQEGQNTVTLRFKAANTTAGWLLTGLCAAVFASALLWRRKTKKKRNT